MTDLGTLGGRTSSGAGINDGGQVTGISDTPGAVSHGHAFLYSNGQMMDLGTLGGSSSGGSDINNAGQVTGASATGTGVFHAFLYSNGQMMDLGTLGGSTSSVRKKGRLRIGV
jgi:probable HAF family extracellular repeat protein